jgi:hypothetical protein
MTKRELLEVLKTLLAALVAAETPEPKPPPMTPVVPPTPTPIPKMLPVEHQPHLKLDRYGFQVFCCPRHEELFEQHVAAHNQPPPQTPLGAAQWQYIRKRLG